MATSAKPAGVKEIREFFDTPERPMTLPDMKSRVGQGRAHQAGPRRDRDGDR